MVVDEGGSSGRRSNQSGEKRCFFSARFGGQQCCLCDLLLEIVDRALSADVAAAVDVGVGGDSGS